MIGLVVPGNLKFCPYVNYYIDVFKKENISYEIINWNKKGLAEESKWVLDYSVDDHKMIRKTVGYFKFAHFVKKICKKRNYDELYVFTIAPAIAVSHLLLKEYKGKYCLDVRDDTILRKIFRKKIQEIVDNANFVVSSSKEYEKWLNRETILSHNVDINCVEKALNDEKTEDNNLHIKADLQKIMFAGSMIEGDINLEVIKKLQNDERFLLIYHSPEGIDKRKLVDYCNENQVKNVEFFGAYKKEEIYEIYRKQSDWCNIIRHESEVNRNALPNKFYDAMIAGVPVVVLRHNYAVSNYVEKYNLGLILDTIENFSEEFDSKLKTFDFESFEEGRKYFLQEVLKDYDEFKSVIVKIRLK